MYALIYWLTNQLKKAMRRSLRRKTINKNPKKNLLQFMNHNQKKKPRQNLRNKPKLLFHKNQILSQFNKVQNKYNQNNQNKMIKRQLILKDQNNLFQHFSFSNNNKKIMWKSFTPVQVSPIFQKWWEKSGEDCNKAKSYLMYQRAKFLKKNMKKIWKFSMKNIQNKNLKINSRKKKLNQKSKKR